jgi:hypothetical protein
LENVANGFSTTPRSATMCTVQKLNPRKIPETSKAPIQDSLKCPRYENKLPGKLISESWGGYLLLMVYTQYKKITFQSKKIK